MFESGTKVKFRQHVGVINFVDDQYITICVKYGEVNRVNDVNIVVYPHWYDEVKPILEQTTKKETNEELSAVYQRGTTVLCQS